MINQPYKFLEGGGEMGGLIRSVDWAKTAIGPIDAWPQSLRIATSIMLSSPFPMYIAWGQDFIQLYNDGYRPILGSSKHPQAMGIGTRETFSEIWHIIGPMFEGVMAGTPIGFPNFMLPLNRNGYIEECYFDFSYSPIRHENGDVGGVLVTVIEVTEKFKSINKLKEINQELERSDALFRTQIKQAPVAIALLKGPELIIDSANDMMLALWGKTNQIINYSIDVALPELGGQPFLKLLKNVFATGETFYGTEAKASLEHNGQLKDLYFNFVYHPIKDETGSTVSIMVVANEVTEQVLARRVVEDNAKRFRFLLNAIPQQVWTATPDGALDYVNQVVCNDFGKNMETIVGQGWQEFIHPDDLEECLKKWTSALRVGTEYIVEFRLCFHDGKYVWHLGRALPLIENGQVTLWLGTNTNISLQKSNEQRKDEFLSIASHELKTPLTSIKAFNQLMKRTTDHDKIAGFVKKSAEHIVRLEKLINDLLDVTKINAGKMSYNMQSFNFKQMLAESVESVQYAAPSHQIILENIDDIEYTGDHFRLEQVVINFLTNAIKYSPNADTIKVKCIVEAESIIVSVQDYGIGIAPESLDKLFERYYRVDNTAMRFEGLGLGLFISSEILKRHHGNFWIESQLGKGSIFYFRLPLIHNKPVKQAVKTKDVYQDDHVTIKLNKNKGRLDIDWTGFQNLQTVQNGCMMMLEAMKNGGVHKIVNDNTHVLGSWSEAVEWTGGQWFPMMEKAGLKYFALIYSPSVFSQLSAKKSIDVGIGSIVAQYFTEVQLAEEWIDKCP